MLPTMSSTVGAIFLSVALFGFSVNAGARLGTGEFFEAELFAEIDTGRGLVVDSAGDVLVVAAGAQSIIALVESSDGEVTQFMVVDGTGLGLNHGITWNNGFLYASSQNIVYRWAYTPGSRTRVQEEPIPVVDNMPSDGHDTRTLAFDSMSRLYVHVGSGANVDQDSSRARIRRFDLSQGLPSQPYNFENGEVFADGLRNEVSFDFDRNGVLWGVENGVDLLNRPDLGGDIHNDNPAEEFNRFDRPVGTHYGYPYCFSTYALEGYPAGTQFAHPQFMDDGVHTDEWCKTLSNNQPPILAMPAHQAPLGIQFYRGQNCDGPDGAFPCDFTGDAFVAFHGSWNSDIPVGYRLTRIPFTKTEPFVPTGEIIDVLYEDDLANCAACFRPVNAVFNPAGHLIVSSDESGEIFRVTYNNATVPGLKKLFVDFLRVTSSRVSFK